MNEELRAFEQRLSKIEQKVAEINAMLSTVPSSVSRLVERLDTEIRERERNDTELKYELRSLAKDLNNLGSKFEHVYQELSDVVEQMPHDCEKHLATIRQCESELMQITRVVQALARLLDTEDGKSNFVEELHHLVRILRIENGESTIINELRTTMKESSDLLQQMKQSRVWMKETVIRTVGYIAWIAGSLAVAGIIYYFGWR